jgi:hypothetical protein
MRKLNVKKTNKEEVMRKWDIATCPVKWADTMYIRCNAKGEVNWEVATLYQPNELIERGHFNIL